MTMIYHGNWGDERAVYTEEQLKSQNLENLVKHELQQHNPIESIQTFRGWTPSFILDEAGFKQEACIPLVTIGKKVENIMPDGNYLIDSSGNIKKATSMDISEAAKLVGTEQLLNFPENQQLLKAAYERLNAAGISFLVFRTYRGWPAVWDNVYFYSQGNFNRKL